MKKFIMTMAVLAMAAGVAQAQVAVAPQNPQHEQTVQVSGRAEKKITPDEIFMNIVIKDGEVRNQNVNQLESTVKRQLKGLGIYVEKDLRINDAANAPRRRNLVDTRRSYELKVGDVRTLNSVFEMLGELGISEASVTRVSHSRMDDFRREVRVMAIRNARQSAQDLAEAVGQSIGPAVFILDNGNMFETGFVAPITRSYRAVSDMVYAKGSSAEPSMDFRDITLTYSVMAKFVLDK